MAVIHDSSSKPAYDSGFSRKHFNGGTHITVMSSTLIQTVNVLNGVQCFTAAELDNGTLRVFISYYQWSSSVGLPVDSARVSLEFRTLNRTVLLAKNTSASSCSDWCSQSFNYSLPIGTRLVDYIMVFEKPSGTSIDSNIDGNSLQLLYD